MQQRRVRLGDILDDYCPRERRVTNHAVVAMIEEDVKQTRCTTCDAEHEYKHAKVPSSRRKKPDAPAAVLASGDPVEAPSLLVSDDADEVDTLDTVDVVEPPSADGLEAASEAEVPETGDEVLGSETEDEWPVHRPLIRAQLPRPEGQTPERKPTDFTIRQTGGRFEGERNGNRARGKGHHRQAQGHGQSRFSGARSGSGQPPRHGGGQHTGNSQRQGNRPGPPSGQRGRPGHGGGQGRGPKRGR